METSRAPRREGVPRIVVKLVLLALAGCSEPPPFVDENVGSARLGVRYAAATEPSALKGPLPLGGAAGERGLLYVPESYQAGTSAALVVLLHGAGGSAENILPLLKAHADATGTVVLAPKAVDRTWDLISRDRYGSDLQFLDETLARVFREYAVDPERVTISGFSDGASYALSVGLTNGDLFRRIAAFSPGGAAASELNGRPAIFISHGTQDPVLPVDLGGRFLTEKLREEDYSVEYRQFEGTHTVPEDIAREGFLFLVGAAAP